jgi:ribonucleoside-diphosphate reductase alpha chain
MAQSTTPETRINPAGVTVERRLTREGVHPFDEVEWELRDAIIGDPENPAFEQRGVEFPRSWSQNATNIVAQKYFRGQLGSDERETSVKQMIGRVAGTIAGWGREGGYFASDEDADAFEAELTAILLHQEAAFNSPVWFNVGFEEKPQCSACFILSVEDTMESILDWNTKEGMIFRGGSGSGINLSNIRGSVEHLSKGGTASGPVSFMRGADDQVGRQDPPGGQDGRAQRRPPRHRALRLVQGQRGEEGRCPQGRRLRHVDRRRGLHLDPVPERQQLGPGIGRLHGGLPRRRRVGPDREVRRVGHQDPPGP